MRCSGFIEKPLGDGGFINGGFFVLSPKVIDEIAGDSMPWEVDAARQSGAQRANCRAFAHRGFWQPMDTLRDKIQLEDMWQRGAAPWKCWA